VDWREILFGIILVALLLFLGLFYAWRQVAALRQLRSDELPGEERRHYRGQAVRRLVSSVLLLVLAALLTYILIELEGPARQLVERIDATPPGEIHEQTPQDRTLARLYGSVLILFLILLMAVVLLAGYDVWATRRYGLRQFRKLQTDRRAMLERQLSRLREEGNGRH
jgi:hypothetical protein